MFWFVGTAVATVWFVFRDVAFDHRLLIVGSVLPAIVDGVWGGARAMHSLTASVALLAGVMVATRRRSPWRRTLLGLPIGMLLHLVYTGAWATTEVFWWPFAGIGFGGAPHPVASRGWWNVLLELIGLGLCWWVVRRARLSDRARYATFLRTGQLDLAVIH